MSKLQPQKYYKKSGYGINAYKITLKKTEAEKAGFNEKSEIDISYSQNKIIISKTN